MIELKWYWLAEWFNLVRNTSSQYNDGHTYYEVSAKADEFFAMLTWSCIPAWFLLGLLILWIATWKKRAKAGRKVVRAIMVVLFMYAIFLAVGIGPYIQWYPQTAGFLDFSALEHAIEGGYCGFLALMLWLGSCLGGFVARKMGGKEYEKIQCAFRGVE